MDTTALDHPGLGILASVSSPALGLEWSGAAGPASRSDPKKPLQPRDTCRIASVTKVFVAGAIFRLVEQGKIGLYEPITTYISPRTAQLLSFGGYDPKAIQVQHLLAHTSGLYDYAMDDAYQQKVGAHPQRRWTRLEQIEFAIKHGKPIGPPGRQYSYSDTGYVILGEMIERVSGQSMAAFVRDALSYQKLGLRSTYFESLEQAPKTAPRIHQYWRDVDMTDADASMDLFGGGGIVSTTQDLNRFMRVLLTGKLFERPSTLPAALMPVNATRTEGHPRALLLYTIHFGPRTCWGHGGFWGIESRYCPDIDLAVTTSMSMSIDDPRRGYETLVSHFFAELSKLVAPNSGAQRQ